MANVTNKGVPPLDLKLPKQQPVTEAAATPAPAQAKQSWTSALKLPSLPWGPGTASPAPAPSGPVLQRGLTFSPAQFKTTPLDPRDGLMGEAGDSKRRELKAMTPEQRAEALAAMDPKDRMLLLGGSALQAGVHTTGEAFDVDWAKTRPPHTRGYDAQTEWQMAVAAKRSYEPLGVEGSTEVTPAVADLAKAGFKIEYLGTDKTSTQGFVAIRGQEAIVAFRGTEPDKMNDLMSDANLLPKLGYGPFPGAAHSGFNNALDEVWPRLETVLKKAQADLPEGQKLSVNLTGHSLGAAIATLAAWRIDEQKLGDVDGVHTFGSPRVLNIAAANTYDQRLGEVTYRHENNADMVAKVPNLGWQHVGQHVFTDHLGNQTTSPDPSLVLLEAQRAIMEDQKNGLTQSRGNEIEPLWDHAIDGYAKLQWVNANSPVSFSSSGR